MGLSQREIRISIDSLRLNGFSRREADRFEAALRSELSALLSTNQEFASSQSERLTGETRRGDAESMGRNVAHTIFEGLKHG